MYTYGELATPSPSSTSAVPTPAMPTVSATPDGCYTEATSGRALSEASYYDDLMTVQKCEAVCAGYTYMGLEYHRECFCGDFFNIGSVKTLYSECSFECPGDNTQKCGAGNRLNVYIVNNGQSSSTTSSLSTLSTVTSSIVSSTTDPSSSYTSTTSSEIASSSSTTLSSITTVFASTFLDTTRF